MYFVYITIDMGNYTYPIHFLKGPEPYIEQEPLEKYPRFEIIMTENGKKSI